MTYRAEVICDSISPDGVRLCTMTATFPRFILAEFNTHRMLSRNAASSRAVPVAKMIERVEQDPFVPEYWGKNQKGMQAGEGVENPVMAEKVWRLSARTAVDNARWLLEYGVHKQLVNRLLEPFAWVTVVASATDWNNFFALRCHPDAQPEFQRIAGMMREAMGASEPVRLDYGDWHLPFVKDWEHGHCTLDELKLVSAGRCARVSYLTHDGRHAPGEDANLARRLIAAVPKHASPFEHPARPLEPGEQAKGNFRGYRQFRHEIPDESVKG